METRRRLRRLLLECPSSQVTIKPVVVIEVHLNGGVYTGIAAPHFGNRAQEILLLPRQGTRVDGLHWTFVKVAQIMSQPRDMGLYSWLDGADGGTYKWKHSHGCYSSITLNAWRTIPTALGMSCRLRTSINTPQSR